MRHGNPFWRGWWFGLLFGVLLTLVILRGLAVRGWLDLSR